MWLPLFIHPMLVNVINHWQGSCSEAETFDSFLIDLASVFGEVIMTEPSLSGLNYRFMYRVPFLLWSRLVFFAWRLSAEDPGSSTSAHDWRHRYRKWTPTLVLYCHQHACRKTADLCIEYLFCCDHVWSSLLDVYQLRTLVHLCLHMIEDTDTENDTNTSSVVPSACMQEKGNPSSMDSLTGGKIHPLYNINSLAANLYNIN